MWFVILSLLDNILDESASLSSKDRIEEILNLTKQEDFVKLRIPCKKCNKTFKINVPRNIAVDVDQFPFPIILMHSAEEDGKRKIHTMLAYIDQNLKCRHVDHLKGQRVYITPYIVYNPSMLSVYCAK